MAPIELEILLNIYYSPVWQKLYKTNILNATVDNLMRLGVIRHRDEWGCEYHREHDLEMTDKGKAWIHLILNVEPPKQAWIDKNGEIINFE